MKIPGNESGVGLIKKLSLIGYIQTRQIGSHIRLARIIDGKEQYITIPNHNPLRIGTFSNILSEVAEQTSKTKKKLLINFIYNQLNEYTDPRQWWQRACNG